MTSVETTSGNVGAEEDEVPRPQMPPAGDPEDPGVHGIDPDIAQVQPGAYFIEGFASSQRGQESEDEAPAPLEEGIEALPFAAEVVRSERQVEEEARQRIIEEAQKADVIPPEKFFSIRNRKLIVTLAVCVLAIVGVAVGLTFGLNKGDESDSSTKDENQEASVPQELVDLLSPVSGEEPLLDPTTPQYEAAMWLAWNDTADIGSSKDSETEIQQRYIIVLLYFISSGANWLNQFSFLSEASVCEWNDDDSEHGIFCDDNGSVSQIVLGSNNLDGSLPDEITHLTELRKITAENNSLIGSIMPSFGNLKALERFDVSINDLTGTIPESTFSLMNLSQLLLGGNDIGGTISSNIGKLVNLKSFNCTQCQLSGKLPSELFVLGRLDEVKLGGNMLSGQLPLILQRPTLRILELNSNELEGNLNDLTVLSVNMVHLTVSNNKFTGTLPTFTTAFDRLEVFSAWGNRLSGNLIDFFAAAPRSLKRLLLHQNAFTGSLPKSIGDYTNMEEVTAFQNSLGGTLPTELGLLTSQTERVRLDSNQFRGTIPTELGLMSQLTTLHLGNNNLSGTIPEELAGAPRNLDTIGLGSNDLSGTIPPAIGSLPFLRALDVSNNRLNGTLPDFSANQDRLVGVFAQNNQLSGRLDLFLTKAPSRSLQHLYVQQNGFSGSLPRSIGEYTSMITLHLQQNKLTGTLPSELGKLVELTLFPVGENTFHGPIPTELGKIRKLLHFTAPGNSLTGLIPAEIGNCTDLVSLDLSSIPQAVANLPNLEGIVLDQNRLIGTLPDFAANQGKLSFFSVWNNSLSGSVELLFSTTPVKALTTVSLTMNQFTGSTPPSIGLYSKMEDLRMLQNQFSGSIPSEIGLLSSLSISILLSNNNFNGSIPTELGQLTDLSQLALHENRLTGTIPSELGECTSLQSLFLHSNLLNGTIPEDLAFLPTLDTFWVQKTQVSGSLNSFCERDNLLSALYSDCLGSEISCPCCQRCCNDTLCCNTGGSCFSI